MLGRGLSTAVGALAVLWTALFVTTLVSELSGADCAEASSEVADPCAWGLGLWAAGTTFVWGVGIGAFALVWVLARRTGRGR
jgi:hypothetical protein